MYCIKCGREVADGELFCRNCSNQPGERKPEPEHRQPERGAEAQQTARSTQPGTQAPKKRRMNALLIPFTVLCILTVAACVCVLQFYNAMNVTKNNYRVKEANLESQISELEDTRQELDEVKLELHTVTQAYTAGQTTISELQAEITRLEGTASQGAYDATSAQQTIERLDEEKTALSEQITELETEVEALSGEITLMSGEIGVLESDLQQKEEALAAREMELERLNEQLAEAEEKAGFMDSYIVFVNGGEAEHYHRYDCAQFTKSNFWAYSRKLAESYGYTACSECGG